MSEFRRGEHKNGRAFIGWTEEMDAALYQAWHVERKSAKQCAIDINRHFGLDIVTRNAIIGRVHRKLANGSWPERVTDSSISAKLGAKIRKPRKRVLTPNPVSLAPITKKTCQGHPRIVVARFEPIKVKPTVRGHLGGPEKSYFTLRRTRGDGDLIHDGITLSDATGCLYAIGHNAKGQHVFCNGEKLPGKPWCEGHYGLVYQPRN